MDNTEILTKTVGFNAYSNVFYVNAIEAYLKDLNEKFNTNFKVEYKTTAGYLVRATGLKTAVSDGQKEHTEHFPLGCEREMLAYVRGLFIGLSMIRGLHHGLNKYRLERDMVE